jgi:hypothetical protein
LLVLRAAAVLVPLTRPGPDTPSEDDLHSPRLPDEPVQAAGARRARAEIEAMLARPVAEPQSWPAFPRLCAQLGRLVADTLRLAAGAVDRLTSRD